MRKLFAHDSQVAIDRSFGAIQRHKASLKQGVEPAKINSPCRAAAAAEPERGQFAPGLIFWRCSGGYF